MEPILTIYKVVLSVVILIFFSPLIGFTVAEITTRFNLPYIVGVYMIIIPMFVYGYFLIYKPIIKELSK